LIHKNLFPLLAGWNEDPETDFEQFAVWSFNYDLCCEEIEYEQVRASYLFGLVFYLESDEMWEAVEARFGLKQNDLPEIKDRPNPNLWHLLGKSGRNEQIELYVDLFETVDHSTGNPWLDARNCCQYPDFFSWSAETISELAGTYREANEMLERLETLHEFIL
jgi:hypothetical protein